ncbi:ATP-binding protein [Spirillospora sp. CA-128828]|uniref:ATP-binding protein n=1 Tax=Spirillospora sp. CA-128828 TaxID=3240033 RepID=UPI003D8AB13F
MRIASRAVAPPSPKGAEGPSHVVGKSGQSEPFVRTNSDGTLAFPVPPKTHRVTDDGASTESDRDGRVWRVEVPGAAEAIPLLRRWVHLLLDDELAEAFELIVSEYGTNALWHTASSRPDGRIRAELRISSQQTCLTVLDDGPAPARSDRSADPAEHGRGLLLVDAYADETGQYDGADGHAIWALIRR